MREPQLASVSKNEERRALLGAGWARWSSFSLTARACCVRMDLLGFLPPPRVSPGSNSLLSKHHPLRLWQLLLGTWVLLDLQGISVLAHEKKGMRKRKMLERMKERRGDSSRPDFFCKRRGGGRRGDTEMKRRTVGQRSHASLWDALKTIAAKLMKITVGLLGLCGNIFLKMKICFMQCWRSYFKTSLPSNKLLIIQSILKILLGYLFWESRK